MAYSGGQREPGLPSINDSRRRRRRAIVLGRVQLKEAAPQMWLWIFAGMAALGVIYWRYSEGQLINQKAAVMARQRAIATVLGPKIFPFRQRIEQWTMQLASPWPGDHLDAKVDAEQLTHSTGVYLRLPIEQAGSPEDIAKAANQSVRDGFTSCMFPQKHAIDPTLGQPCQAIANCPAGLLCNEYQVCVPPGEPFNLRMMYPALHVLDSKWSDELHAAPNDLSVRRFEMDLEKATDHDVPLAVDLLTRSKYFTVLLDEPKSHTLQVDSTADLPVEKETNGEWLQRMEHPVRVGIWNLQSGDLVLRLRTSVTGQALPVGGNGVTDPRTLAAQQRQVNNCALALAVKEALTRAVQAPAPTTP
ncbi:MAG TPA: hypothetical protein VL137_07875 [Polyangiaceae bacterium]|nr:hypothetical protein [Polyangiaceae bacterium]